jgi:hypothetical protein
MVAGIDRNGLPMRSAKLGRLAWRKDRIAYADNEFDARRTPWGEVLVRCQCGVEFWCELYHVEEDDDVEPARADRFLAHECDDDGDVILAWRKVTKPLNPVTKEPWNVPIATRKGRLKDRRIVTDPKRIKRPKQPRTG